jgi:hypothetical protein
MADITTKNLYEKTLYIRLQRNIFMKKYYLLTALLTLLLTSCSTYYMTSTSLKEQLQKVDPNKIKDSYDFRLGILIGSLKGKNFYNGIESIRCTDKKGKEKIVKIQTNTGIIMTDNTGKKETLYFDSVFLRDSLVYGSKSHFITLPVTPMNINNLKVIKIQ